MENLVDLMTIGSYVIAIASVVVKLTPTETDNLWLAKVLKVLKVVSLAK